MSRFRLLPPAFVAFLVTAGVAFAQDAAPKKSGVSFLDAIKASGVIGAIIILMSVVALALIIEHFMTIKREKLAPPEIVDEVEELFAEGNYQEALEVCESNPTYYTRVVAAGIRKLGHPFDTVEKAVEEMEDEETIRLMQKIGWLSLIAGIGPMMGLFGTVLGMVGAFGTIASAGQGGVNPADFAGDIQLALVTTLEGLMVAIPTTAFFAYFRNRVTTVSIEIGAMVEDLFDRFRGVE